jgi:HrpA-like RNA helicase
MLRRDDIARDHALPGRDRQWRHRQRQEHAAAEDLPGNRARHAGLIAHTQPRRIAAQALANRVSAELGTTSGDLVGYQVRFVDRTSPRTLVKLMTDGLLLRELESDPLLLRYDTLIIDEAHERNLNVDFLLGVCRRLLPRRPDLRLIVTSATIETQRFADFFGGAPGDRRRRAELSG